MIIIYQQRYTMIQMGGEYLSYRQLTPENSRRIHPLGYLSNGDLIDAQMNEGPQRHTSFRRTHSHQAVNTSGEERRHPTGQYYLSRDEFDWKPYDWRPFEWRPYWQRRANLLPSARNCSQYATDNCIGTGMSDYQTCYDLKINNCTE